MIVHYCEFCGAGFIFMRPFEEDSCDCGVVWSLDYGADGQAEVIAIGVSEKDGE